MPQTAPPNEDSTILSILKDSHTIAVVGLSPRPERDSHHVAEYLQQQGYRIVPVNPTATDQTILGERCWRSLSDAAEQHRIDVVDVFRNSADVPAPTPCGCSWAYSTTRRRRMRVRLACWWCSSSACWSNTSGWWRKAP